MFKLLKFTSKVSAASAPVISPGHTADPERQKKKKKVYFTSI